jgi:FG-GAP-like repeat
LDGDGDPDALVANRNQPNRVWLNQGNGIFESGQALGNHNISAVSLGDVDGDGDLDAFVANYHQPNRVWLNQGNGTFTDSGQLLGNNYSSAVSLGDLDGDGDLDAFVADDNQPNRVWMNQGGAQGGTAGQFSDSGQALGNHQSTAVALGDLDGEGDLDAFVAKIQQPNKVWLNVSTVLFGDFHENNVVDAADHTVWRDAFENSMP